MKISAKLDYAMRLLVKLAANPDDIIQTAEVANTENVSLKFLHGICKQLKDANIVDTIVGPHGGIKLSRHPEKITFLEIYEVFMEDLRVVEPCKEFSACVHLNACGIQSILQEGQMKMRSHFESIKLSHLLARNEYLISQS